MKPTVFFDYHEGQQVPIWLVIDLEERINWDEDYFYIPIQAPFQLKDRGDFDPDILSVSVTMGDLTRNIDHINTVGIYLPRMKQAIHEFGGDVEEIQQFIILVADVEEVLQFNAFRDQLNW